MNKKHVLFVCLISIVLLTFILSFLQTKQFSAYAACRNLAMNTKGYAVWKHVSTLPLVFRSYITFNDGYNSFSCRATGIGPFWVANNELKTNVGCGLSLIPPVSCPEDYFGVEP
ncbi:MAG: hypothetical protein JNK81_05680 [Anaerolineales bacterium]|nr:hypothetical protein [Anaerolineales bacterium]